MLRTLNPAVAFKGTIPIKPINLLLTDLQFAFSLEVQIKQY